MLYVVQSRFTAEDIAVVVQRHGLTTTEAADLKQRHQGCLVLALCRSCVCHYSEHPLLPTAVVRSTSLHWPGAGAARASGL